MFILAVTVVLAFFFDAPLKQPANPMVPENPAKAPWYFLGVQELVSYSAFTGGIGIPLAALFGLAMIPYIDRGSRDFGRWFEDQTGARVAVGSAAYAIICCISILVLTIGFDWSGTWPKGFGKFAIHFINPGTILMLMFIAWSLFVFRIHRSIRKGTIALFTCVVIAVVVITYFAWGHRGPNWDFYWWPLAWQHH